MNLIDISRQYKSLYVCGDIHGEFEELIYNLKRFEIEDAVVIIAGDCGIGFEKKEHYTQLYNKINKTLVKNNIFLILIRGNHDDPSYFDGQHINYPKMKAIPDYSVLQFSDKYILCVGGAVSIDRKHRLQAMWLNNVTGKTVRPLYWENEAAIFDNEILSEISMAGIKISCVVTHTCPSFCHPVSKNGIERWLLEDIELSTDLSNERLQMDKLYNKLVADRHNIENWVYAHFHDSNKEFINNTKFSLLNIMEIKQLIQSFDPVK